jgi:endoglucanase
LPVIALLLSAGSAVAENGIPYRGVNLAGAEFGPVPWPVRFGVDYIHPDPSSVDYYLNKGMNTIRLPFGWERLQNGQFADFNADELARLKYFVSATIC